MHTMWLKENELEEIIKETEFSTAGMQLWEREESYEKGNIIPIGTVCYEAGNFIEDTKKVIVNVENQKFISMFWNSLYFLSEERANRVMQQSKAEYGDFLFGSFGI